MSRPNQMSTFLLLLSCALLAWSPTPVAGSGAGLRPRQYVLCECSPTDRGYRKDVRDELATKMNELSVKVSELESDEKPRGEITDYIVEYTTEVWEDCAREYTAEECANADASLRTACGNSRCASYCEYDSGTWSNWNAKGETAPACDTDSKWAAKSPLITSGKFKPDEVSRSSSNPRPGPKGIPPRVKARDTETPGAPISSISKGTDAGVLPPRKPKRGNDASKSQPESGVSSGIDVGNGTETETGAGVLTATTEPELQPGIPELGRERRQVNEGCVAVEHLEGYVLQHRRHMLRPVLCSEGFCATPNHALIVDGKWTSMSVLCGVGGVLQCVQTKKLVNNLKVLANRRAVINDRITVTPYDARFPRFAVWIVQCLEDSVQLVMYATLLSVLVAFFVLLGAAVKDF